jgi:hypothetical protein
MREALRILPVTGLGVSHATALWLDIIRNGILGYALHFPLTFSESKQTHRAEFSTKQSLELRSGVLE